MCFTLNLGLVLMNTLTGFIVFLIIALVFGYLCHITAERKLSKARAELKAAEERGKPYSKEVASYMMGQPGIIAIFFAFISFLSFIASLYNLVYWFFP